MYKIVLADDHQVVRHGIKAILAAEPDLSFVGETIDGLETLKVVEKVQPDVLIIDLTMPGLSGLEVIRRVSKRSPNTRIVVLSVHSSAAFVLEALRNGATGYVLKESSSSYLVEAVREVLAGRRYLAPPLSEKAIDEFSESLAIGSLDLYEMLTIREREVLHLTSEGHSSREIGEKLLISPRTAEKHRANIMRKLNIGNHSELIRFALLRGILPSEDE